MTTRAPPNASVWPPMYLVAECITISAPSSSGRVSAGVAKVLSTPRSTPCRMAIWAQAAISVIDISGLPGVSIHSILVFGVMAASTAFKSPLVRTSEARMSERLVTLCSKR